jgi:alpha-glucosidase
VTPWLPVPRSDSTAPWAALSVAAQQRDPGSVLPLCRAGLALRRRLLADGRLTDRDGAAVRTGTDGVLLLERGSTTLVVNMGERDAPLPGGDVMLASGPLREGPVLPPDTAAWLDRSREP